MKLHYLPERRPKIFRRVLGVLVAAIISAASANAAADGFRAPTGLGVTVASGDQTTLYGLSTYWDSICTCAPLAERGLDVRIYAQIAYWHGTQRPSDFRSLWEGSVTPALRWIGPSVGPAAVFAEVGLGVSGISHTRINQDRQFSTGFQFNEHFGAHFPNQDFDTIGGLVTDAFGRVPRRGDSVEIGGFRFEVLRADPRQLHLFQITRVPKTVVSEFETADVRPHD